MCSPLPEQQYSVCKPLRAYSIQTIAQPYCAPVQTQSLPVPCPPPRYIFPRPVHCRQTIHTVQDQRRVLTSHSCAAIRCMPSGIAVFHPSASIQTAALQHHPTATLEAETGAQPNALSYDAKISQKICERAMLIAHQNKT